MPLNLKDEISLATDLCIVRDLTRMIENDEPMPAAKLNAILARLKTEGHAAAPTEDSHAGKIILKLHKVREAHEQQILKNADDAIGRMPDVDDDERRTG